MQHLSEQQINFFNTFGFLKLAGALRPQIEEITVEFDAVFPQVGTQHDGQKRTCIVPFVDQREKLAALLDHPAIEGAAASILGADFNYIGGDGNYYTGDTGWHRDGLHKVGRYIKVAFYLDPVRRETGALRVIPTSHQAECLPYSAVGQAHQAERLWGIPQSEVPAVALDSDPGDVLMFDHNLLHAAFGGSNQRGMFTLNLSKHAASEAEVESLKTYLSGMARFWVDRTHGPIMRDTASPARQVHLQQVVENEGHLPALAAIARQTQSEPARG